MLEGNMSNYEKRAGLTMKQTKELLKTVKSISGTDIRFAMLHNRNLDYLKAWIKCQRCRNHLKVVERLDGMLVNVGEYHKKIGVCTHCGQLLLIG